MFFRKRVNKKEMNIYREILNEKINTNVLPKSLVLIIKNKYPIIILPFYGDDAFEVYHDHSYYTRDSRLDRLPNDLRNAVSELHKHSVYHCDIKLENVVWSFRRGCWVLIDFDNAVTDLNEYTTTYSTPPYIHPGWFLSDKPISETYVSPEEMDDYGVNFLIMYINFDMFSFVDGFGRISLFKIKSFKDEDKSIEYVYESFKKFNVDFNKSFWFEYKNIRNFNYR